ncbi:MAG: 23S rRNA (guanosine(2251)-2'-O)-methyltransferase RlmB [Candidatus Pacebacteria bacterium]|nr:23S rRNA (guanosine(2251)-2'-O)-methyltransferase RlmB [Candidatus Paceibacterota bacterium]
MKNTKNKSKSIYIYGKHPVIEALKNKPQIIEGVLIEENLQDKDIGLALKKAGITPSKIELDSRKQIDENPKTHQGIIAKISPDKLMLPYKEFIKSLEISPSTLLVIMGEVQDPHNVGAVIRSAAAFGISGVLIPEHNQAPVTGTVVKVSAGMAFKIPLVAIGNVNTVIRDLKERGFWVYGLDGTSSESLSGEEFEKPSVIIVGNEGDGIREKTREHCDYLLKIPMHRACESLNVAASVSVALYEWSKQHPEALLGK